MSEIYNNEEKINIDNEIIIKTPKKDYNMNEKNKERYKIYKEIDIECPICNKELNLYVINRHINSSKKCNIHQKLKYNDDNDLKFKKKTIKDQLQMIRFKLKNNIDI